MSDTQVDQSAFERLPDEIVQHILQLTDPSSFASLILLNSKWRRVSQQADLFAYQLSQCPSYSASHKTAPAVAPGDDDALPRLRRLFAVEVKRNLLEAYLRPKKTNIKLVSNSISSCSVPGGEGLQFSFSPLGHHLLAYSSSRIYVVDARVPQLEVKRELKILRRPMSTCILDDGSVLAVLSSDMQVDVYDLRESPPKRTQSLILDHTPRAIALSPCGRVLAAAYEGGIEVSSLNPAALPTERRSVKCDGVDSLAFSFDGTQLLGTTTASQLPNTVILTAPYFEPGSQVNDDISALWTTSILFPNTSRDCSHAVLLQESSTEEASWTFTYDRSFETFRAVRIDDLRNGTTYFTGPIPISSSQAILLPCTLPSASYCGQLVSAGFENKDIWIYGIPEDLEAIPNNAHTNSDMPTQPLNRRTSGRSVQSPAHAGRVPQWQILCDRYRNTLLRGRKVTELSGVSAVKWVSAPRHTSIRERLIVTARGVMPPKPIVEDDGIDFVDGGRITILDFDYSIKDGEETDITIEVGTKEPEVLEEEHRDMATEVAIVRRRTVAQRRGDRGGVVRSATTASSRAEALLRPELPAPQVIHDDDDPLVPRRLGLPGTERRPSNQNQDEHEEASLEEIQEALEAPYAHASPRSGTTLRRAATAAAVNRRLHPTTATGAPIEYRRADGRAEHPHESDADHWVPPPPPYSKEDPGDRPAFLRNAPIPGVGLDANGQQRAAEPVAPPQPSPSAPPSHGRPRPTTPPMSTATRPPIPRLHTSPPREMQLPPSLHRQLEPISGESSGHVGYGNPRVEQQQVMLPKTTQPGGANVYQYDPDEDIYDVSPRTTPPPQTSRVPPEQQSQRVTSQQSTGSSSQGAPMSGLSSSGDPRQLAVCQPTDVEALRDHAHSHALSLSIPSPSLNVSFPTDSPAIGGLRNPQTWPRMSHQETTPTAIAIGYPYSAPVSQTDAQQIGADLPPLPRPDQLASLNNRRDQTAPRRASGSFQLGRVPIDGSSQDRPRSARYSRTLQTPPEPEEPLIISTPDGVAGGFDPAPDHRQSLQGLSEAVLHAPVPRRPMTPMGSGTPRPTVERLETIYSMGSIGDATVAPALSNQVVPQGSYGQHTLIPTAPPAPPSQSSLHWGLRHHTSLSRRRSRAKRSAHKNLQNLKSRGWTGKRRKSKKQQPPQQQVDDGSPYSATWTDVGWASGVAANDKESRGAKCVMM